jgi:hypothetical protein
VNIDDRELRALAADLSAMPNKSLKAMRAVFEAGADNLASRWRANAKETSGTHGKHYPASITWQERFSTDLEFEVGPEVGKPQGRMGPGFEYGSVNQPPHLDGNRAADELLPKIEGDIAAVMAGIAVSTERETDLVNYTTKAGVTRLATRAQVSNWTRGSQ